MISHLHGTFWLFTSYICKVCRIVSLHGTLFWILRSHMINPLHPILIHPGILCVILKMLLVHSAPLWPNLWAFIWCCHWIIFEDGVGLTFTAVMYFDKPQYSGFFLGPFSINGSAAGVLRCPGCPNYKIGPMWGRFPSQSPSPLPSPSPSPLP